MKENPNMIVILEASRIPPGSKVGRLTAAKCDDTLLSLVNPHGRWPDEPVLFLQGKTIRFVESYVRLKWDVSLSDLQKYIRDEHEKS